jgi:HSP20 family protein
MNVVKYDPFRELRSLQDEMTRLFTGTGRASFGREEMLNGAWSPRVDIYEDKERLILEAELPGMTSDDFDISVENNVITLKGERNFEKKTDGENYHRVERSYGSFTRSFTLPQSVTAEGATADFDNGVLKVSLPKREETKARKIEVGGTSAGPRTIEAETTGEAETKAGSAGA